MSLIVQQPQSGQNRALVAAPFSAGVVSRVKAAERTSSLQAPIMQLLGHQSEVNACRFHPVHGRLLVSGSSDHSLLVWRMEQGGQWRNALQLKGHTGPVLDVQWTADGRRVFSVSADKSMAQWDVETGERIRKYRNAHQSFIHACAVSNAGPSRVATVSDDANIHIWDVRYRSPVDTIQYEWPVTAVEFAAGQDDHRLFSGSIDNTITAWDRRGAESADTPDLQLTGPADTITCLRVAPDGCSLLSNSMDHLVRIWDIQPFSSVPNRCVMQLAGASHGVDKNLIKCCWSPDGSQVAAGSADRTVCIWDVEQQGRLKYKLPGHKGTVNDVCWHPREPIVASASVDRTLYLGEIEPSNGPEYRSVS